MKTLRKFTLDEFILYANCKKAFKDNYPDAEIDYKWVEECYNLNKQPNMRKYNEINND